MISRPAVKLGKKWKSRRRKQVSLPFENRQYHLHVLGAPGRGKTKFLEGLIRQDILSGQGVCVIDPHGGLYKNLVRWLAARRLLDNPRILLFEPNGLFPDRFAFNPLNFDGLRPEQVDDAIAAMMRTTAAVWGGEDQHGKPLIKRCLPTLLYTLWEHDLTLAEAHLLCKRDEIQQYLTRTVKNPNKRNEWDYFLPYDAERYQDMFFGAANRLQEFVSHDMIRSMIGQRDGTLDFSKCMEDGAVVLVNLGGIASRTSGSCRCSWLTTYTTRDCFANQTSMSKAPVGRFTYTSTSATTASTRTSKASRLSYASSVCG